MSVPYAAFRATICSIWRPHNIVMASPLPMHWRGSRDGRNGPPVYVPHGEPFRQRRMKRLSRAEMRATMPWLAKNGFSRPCCFNIHGREIGRNVNKGEFINAVEWKKGYHSPAPCMKKRGDLQTGAFMPQIIILTENKNKCGEKWRKVEKFV